MGCGTSRIPKEETGATFFFYNPLHRRIEDRLANWRHKAAGRAATRHDRPTTKRLLLEDTEGSVESHSSGNTSDNSNNNDLGQKSVSPSLPLKKVDDDFIVLEGGIKRAPSTQVMKESEAAGDNIGIDKVEKTDRGKPLGGARVAAVDDDKETRNKMENAACPKGNKDNSDKENDEGSKLGLAETRGDSIIYPGSPSFRDSWISSCDRLTDIVKIEDDDDDPDIDRVEKKTIATIKEDEDDASTADSCQPPRKVSTKKSKRKGRRFLMKLSRNRSEGMKNNLLQADACSPRRATERSS